MIQTNKSRSVAALGILVLLGIFTALFVPPLAQDESYHTFADSRTILGIPNFWNVVSNLSFAIVGVIGLLKTRGIAARLLFAGVLLTCFGSAYYHLAPNDARLIWDRLPMTIVFMSFLACVFANEGNQRFNIRLLSALLICGVASVAWWQITGDLRPYAFVQFGPMLILPLAPAARGRGRYFAPIFAFYALAKGAEHFDRLIYAHLSISGHTCKHFLAAVAVYWIFRLCVDAKTTAIATSADSRLDNASALALSAN